MSSTDIQLPWRFYRLHLEALDLEPTVSHVIEDVAGVAPKGADGYIHRLARDHMPSLHGLIALKVERRGRQVTVITAAGKNFADPDLFDELLRLRAMARKKGRFPILIERRTFMKRVSRTSTEVAAPAMSCASHGLKH